MRRSLSLLPLLLAIALTSCDDGDMKVRILAYDRSADDYGFSDVTITTLDDHDRLDGRATTLIGGADITIDYTQGQMTWDDPGYHVAFGGVKSDGVIIPEDFDSLAMVSAYYNIEKAMLFFEEIGLPENSLVHLDTYYWPELDLIETTGEETEMVDNAFYLYVNDSDRGFYVFPWESFEWLPLSMNQGVMTHEYTHAVFDALVHDPNRATVTAGMEVQGANFLYGLNEGCADYMAFALTADPDYMEHSIEKGIYVVQCNSASYSEIVRDVSSVINYDSAIDNGARGSTTDEFCPYDVGAFFASLLYAIALEIDSEGAGETPSDETRMYMARTLMASLVDLGASLRSDFEITDIIDIFVSNLDSESDRLDACTVIESRYAMYYSEVGQCS